jgi:hypothetical protein
MPMVLFADVLGTGVIATAEEPRAPRLAPQVTQ